MTPGQAYHMINARDEAEEQLWFHQRSVELMQRAMWRDRVEPGDLEDSLLRAKAWRDRWQEKVSELVRIEAG